MFPGYFFFRTIFLRNEMSNFSKRSKISFAPKILTLFLNWHPSQLKQVKFGPCMISLLKAFKRSCAVMLSFLACLSLILSWFLTCLVSNSSRALFDSSLFCFQPPNLADFFFAFPCFLLSKRLFFFFFPCCRRLYHLSVLVPISYLACFYLFQVCHQ